jgi:hypothetical protein
MREAVFQELGGDLVEGAGSNLHVGNAQFLRLREHYLALETKLSGDIVNTNGHRYSTDSGTGGAPLSRRGRFHQR